MTERRSQQPVQEPAGAVEALESILAICNETRQARDLQPRMTEIRSIVRAALASLPPVTQAKSGHVTLDESVLVSLLTTAMLGAYRSVRIPNPDPEGAEELVRETLEQVKRFS